MNVVALRKGSQMFTIGKKVLLFVLVVLLAGAPLGCLNINKSPNNKPGTEVNVGGQYGVTVQHDKTSN